MVLVTFPLLETLIEVWGWVLLLEVFTGAGLVLLTFCELVLLPATFPVDVELRAPLFEVLAPVAAEVAFTLPFVADTLAGALVPFNERDAFTATFVLFAALAALLLLAFADALALEEFAVFADAFA